MSWKKILKLQWPKKVRYYLVGQNQLVSDLTGKLPLGSRRAHHKTGSKKPASEIYEFTRVLEGKGKSKSQLYAGGFSRRYRRGGGIRYSAIMPTIAKYTLSIDVENEPKPTNFESVEEQSDDVGVSKFPETIELTYNEAVELAKGLGDIL